MSNDIWNAKRKKLETNVKEAAIELLDHCYGVANITLEVNDKTVIFIDNTGEFQLIKKGSN